MEELSRFELLVGKESLEKLSQKKILVFGLGGVGGNVCDALARSGIKHFTIVDNDVVEITNINRQLIANTKTVGRDKVDVMEEHLKNINPSTEITKRKCFYLPESSGEFDFSMYDYVIDAIDTVTAKIDIICRCIKLGIPVISALGCGNKMDPTMLEVCDISKTSYDPLAKVMRKELRERGINHHKVVYSTEKPIQLENTLSENGRHVPGSSAFVPPAAGILIASEVIRDLLKEEK